MQNGAGRVTAALERRTERFAAGGMRCIGAGIATGTGGTSMLALGKITRRDLLGGVLGLVALAAGAMAAVSEARAADKDVLVFAAASLKNALDEVIAAYSSKPAPRSRPPMRRARPWPSRSSRGRRRNCSSPADLDWMDYVAAAQPDRRRHAPQSPRQQHRSGRRQGQQAERRRDRARLRSRRCSATAGSRSATSSAVPAGKYGKAALEKLGRLGRRRGQARRRPRTCAPPWPSWRMARRRSGSSTRPMPRRTRA